jgi:hypothetical protein
MPGFSRCRKPTLCRDPFEQAQGSAGTLIRQPELRGRIEHGCLGNAESHDKQVLGQRAIRRRLGYYVVRHETILLRIEPNASFLLDLPMPPARLGRSMILQLR